MVSNTARCVLRASDNVIIAPDQSTAALMRIDVELADLLMKLIDVSTATTGARRSRRRTDDGTACGRYPQRVARRPAGRHRSVRDSTDHDET